MMLKSFPEKCRPSIKTISKTLHTDYESAYTMMILEACQYDMHPYDKEVADMIINDAMQYKRG